MNDAGQSRLLCVIICVVDLSTAIARLMRHRAWAAKTLRWARSQECDHAGEVKRTIDVAEKVFQRVVMAAADAEAKQTKN
jgi:hypothetical protein